MSMILSDDDDCYQDCQCIRCLVRRGDHGKLQEVLTSRQAPTANRSQQLLTGADVREVSQSVHAKPVKIKPRGGKGGTGGLKAILKHGTFPGIPPSRVQR